MKCVVACVDIQGYRLVGAGLDPAYPCAVVSQNRLAEVSPAAREAGLLEGTHAGAAPAVCPTAELRDESVEGSERVWRAWLDAVSAEALAVQPLAQGRALLDMRGYRGAEPAAARAISRQAASMGLQATLGLAPGVGSARVALNMARRMPRRAACLMPPLAASLAPVSLQCAPDDMMAVATRCLRMGILTFGDLAGMSRRTAVGLCGRGIEMLWTLAHGVDDRRVQALWPLPAVQLAGEAPPHISRGDMEHLWRNVGRQMWRRIESQSLCCVRLEMGVITERARRWWNGADFTPALSDGGLLERQLLRLWARYDVEDEPERWDLLARCRPANRPRQLCLDDVQPERLSYSVDDALQSLRQRFGESAPTNLALIAVDWNQQMRGLYEPQNLALYSLVFGGDGDALWNPGAVPVSGGEHHIGPLGAGGTLVGRRDSPELICYGGRRTHSVRAFR